MPSHNFEFRVNPPASALSTCCSVLNGRARRYQVAGVRTSLSLKTVRSGSALYQIRSSRHLVTDDTVLILNHDEAYDLEFNGPGETETLCPFFALGFVEQAATSLTRSLRSQLDSTDGESRATEFHQRLYPKRG